MLAIGAGLGYWFSPKAVQTSPNAPAERKPLYYRNPMNPAITSPVPARDSMGMDYIPVYVGNDKQNEVTGTVRIDPVVVQNIGVRTKFAQRKTFGRSIRAAGRVDFDEQKMVRLHPKVEGWIEEIYINKTGQSVDEDDILLSIYSPKLVSTQQEYLLALNNLSVLKNSPIKEIQQGAIDLANSSRQRLKLLDVPEHQIVELEETRKIKKSLHIHTPVAGTVIKIGSRQGQYVTPGTELYMIVDLSKVWVYADIYEYELPWVKEGDRVEMTLASVPGRVFTGSLSYIYPYAEPKTRTTRVRMIFDNPDRLLRPDMFAEVVIQSDSIQDALVIPAEAVIRSGNTTQVFVQRAPGKFEPRIVRLGIESGGEVIVLEGLKDGEEVVTSAQFLVDSESKLKEATAKMLETMVDGDGKADHLNMDHDEHSAMSMKQENMDTDQNEHSSMNMNHENMEMDHNEHSAVKMNHEGMDHSTPGSTDDGQLHD